jgi:hypothetical protein
MMKTTHWFAAGMAALLVACGGGGGGDASENPSLEITGPKSIDISVYETEQLTPATIRGRLAGGDVKRLEGKTLYLLAVTEGDPIFKTAQPYIDTDGLGGGLILGLAQPAVPDGVRDHKGTITVRACLDPDCKSELTVQNAKVPYTVRVKKGLSVRSPAEFQSTFGAAQVPAAVTVPVDLPDNVVSWSLSDAGGTNDFYRTVIRADKAADGSAAIVVSVNHLTLPGKATQDIMVKAVTPDGHELRRLFTATMTTAPGSVTYAFQRPQPHFVVKAGHGSLVEMPHAGLNVTDGNAGRATLGSITYGPGNILEYGWLYPGTAGLSDALFGVDLRAQVCYEKVCLPVGRYEATVVYRVAPLGGAVVEMPLVVTLDVVP